MREPQDERTSRPKARIPRWIWALAVVALAVGVYVMRPAANSGSNADTDGAAIAAGQQSVDEQQSVAALPRLVDLGADKCVPCKMMAPILAELKTEFADKFVVEFIDVWKNEGAGAKYGIRVIPTQVFFAADGTELFRHEGFYGREDILAKWRQLGIEL